MIHLPHSDCITCLLTCQEMVRALAWVHALQTLPQKVVSSSKTCKLLQRGCQEGLRDVRSFVIACSPSCIEPNLLLSSCLTHYPVALCSRTLLIMYVHSICSTVTSTGGVMALYSRHPWCLSECHRIVNQFQSAQPCCMVIAGYAVPA